MNGPASAWKTVLEDLAGQLDSAPLTTREILKRVTSTLSRAHAGTWVATVLNRDPTTSQIVAADDVDGRMAEYVERFVAAMGRPGTAGTVGLSRHVIESGNGVFRSVLPWKDFLSFMTAAGTEYFSRHPLPEGTRPDTVGVIMVPMRTRGTIVGSLGVFTRDVSGQLSDADFQGVQCVADRVAQFVDSAEAHAAAREPVERLQMTHRLIQALAANQDQRLLVHTVLDQVVAGLRADAADLLLVDEAGANLYVSAHVGFAGTTMPEYRLAVPPELYQADSTRISPEGITQLNRLRRSQLAREGFRSHLAQPVLIGGRLLGVLEAFRRGPLHPDRDCQDYFELLGFVAGLAVAGERRGRQPRSASSPLLRSTPRPPFSAVEAEVLALAVDGVSNRRIATELHLSESTVKFHLQRILRKADARNRTELARRATRNGWA